MVINPFNTNLDIIAVNFYISSQNTIHFCTPKFRLDTSLRRRRRSGAIFVNF